MADEKAAQTVINMGIWTTKTVAIVAVICLLIGSAGGWYLAGKFHSCPAAKCPDIPALQVQPQCVSGAATVESEITVKPLTTPGSVVEIVNTDGKVTVQAGGQKVEVPAPKGQQSMTLGKDSTIQVKQSYDFKVDVTDMVKAQVNDKLAIQNAELRRQHDEEMRKLKARNNAVKIEWGLGGFVAGFAAGRLSK